MKEIAINELTKYYDPLALEHDPAIALACDGERTNGLTIGWGSVGVLWRKPAYTAYVHATRFSKLVFDNAEYFSICCMKPEDKAAVNYFGRVSGRDEDKMAKCGLEVVDSDVAPYFANSRVVILCRTMGRSDFDVDSVDAGVSAWYQRDGVHTQYYGEIVKVLVSE